MTLFSELLQVALGQRNKLSRVPSDDEWAALFAEAKRQAVLGILFCGVEQLPESQGPPEAVLMRWIAFASKIEARNAKWDQRSLLLQQKLSDIGLRTTILKGQGVARLYGTMANRRQNGDIDVFVDGGMELVESKIPREKVRKWGYKHADLKLWSDTEVEVHYRVEHMYSHWRDWRLQKWFDSHKEELFHRDGEWVTPTLEMNLFYLLLHIYRHFFYSGVGLRQIIDYYFCLKKYSESMSNEFTGYALAAVKSFGMERFARGLMWVMGETLAMPREWMPWTPDEREGRFILAQVLAGGNFGHHGKGSSRPRSRMDKKISILRHKLHLFRHYPAETIASPFWSFYNKVRESKYEKRNKNNQ